MLLRSEARVVQAMEAIETNAARAGRARFAPARGRGGGPPAERMLGQFPRVFAPVYVNIVAAGEASGNLGLAFERLSTLSATAAGHPQQGDRSTLTYPAVLMLMCVGVIIALFTFILPRFAEMFDTMGVELPTVTALMIGTATWLCAQRAGHVCSGRPRWRRRVLLPQRAGPVLLVAADGARAGVRRHRAQLDLRPGVPHLGQLLDSKVGLVEAVELTRQSTSSLDFRELLEKVGDAITRGELVGPGAVRLQLAYAVHLRGGHRHGRGERQAGRRAALFVAGCLEDENEQVLGSLTRLIEPIMLVIMGGIVGTAAVSLFLPMFDMAAQAGH